MGSGLLRSTGNGRRRSCTSGSVARSSTPSWAPMWWSSFTARATPAGQPRARGRSSAGPIAAIGWPASAPAAATAATPTAPVGPIAPADLTNPRSGGRLRMLDDPTHPDQLDSEPRLRPTARHLCAGTEIAHAACWLVLSWAPSGLRVGGRRSIVPILYSFIPRCRGASREQSREHRGSGSAWSRTPSALRSSATSVADHGNRRLEALGDQL